MWRSLESRGFKDAMSGAHPSCFSLTTAFITNLMKLYQAPPTSLLCDVTRDPQGEQDRYGYTNFKELTGRQELNNQREDEHSLGDKRQVQAGAMLTHSVEPPLPGQEEAGMFQAEEDTGKAAVTADGERAAGKSGKQAGYLQQRLGGPLGLLLQCLLRLIKNFVFDSRRRHLQ